MNKLRWQLQNNTNQFPEGIKLKTQPNILKFNTSDLGNADCTMTILFSQKSAWFSYRIYKFTLVYDGD